MNTTDQFITGLRIAAEQTGMSTRKAAIAAGVDPSTMWRFMNRQSDIQLLTLTAICNAYNMSIRKVIELGGA